MTENIKPISLSREDLLQRLNEITALSTTSLSKENNTEDIWSIQNIGTPQSISREDLLKKLAEEAGYTKIGTTIHSLQAGATQILPRTLENIAKTFESIFYGIDAEDANWLARSVLWLKEKEQSQQKKYLDPLEEYNGTIFGIDGQTLSAGIAGIGDTLPYVGLAGLAGLALAAAPVSIPVSVLVLGEAALAGTLSYPAMYGASLSDFYRNKRDQINEIRIANGLPKMTQEQWEEVKKAIRPEAHTAAAAEAGSEAADAAIQAGLGWLPISKLSRPVSKMIAKTPSKIARGVMGFGTRVAEELPLEVTSEAASQYIQNDADYSANRKINSYFIESGDKTESDLFSSGLLPIEDPNKGFDKVKDAFQQVFGQISVTTVGMQGLMSLAGIGMKAHNRRMYNRTVSKLPPAMQKYIRQFDNKLGQDMQTLGLVASPEMQEQLQNILTDEKTPEGIRENVVELMKSSFAPERISEQYYSALEETGDPSKALNSTYDYIDSPNYKNLNRLRMNSFADINDRIRALGYTLKKSAEAEQDESRNKDIPSETENTIVEKIRKGNQDEIENALQIEEAPEEESQKPIEKTVASELQQQTTEQQTTEQQPVEQKPKAISVAQQANIVEQNAKEKLQTIGRPITTEQQVIKGAIENKLPAETTPQIKQAPQKKARTRYDITKLLKALLGEDGKQTTGETVNSIVEQSPLNIVQDKEGTFNNAVMANVFTKNLKRKLQPAGSPVTEKTVYLQTSSGEYNYSALEKANSTLVIPSLKKGEKILPLEAYRVEEIETPPDASQFKTGIAHSAQAETELKKAGIREIVNVEKEELKSPAERPEAAVGYGLPLYYASHFKYYKDLQTGKTYRVSFAPMIRLLQKKGVEGIVNSFADLLKSIAAQYPNEKIRTSDEALKKSFKERLSDVIDNIIPILNGEATSPKIDKQLARKIKEIFNSDRIYGFTNSKYSFVETDAQPDVLLEELIHLIDFKNIIPQSVKNNFAEAIKEQITPERFEKIFLKDRHGNYIWTIRSHELFARLIIDYIKTGVLSKSKRTEDLLPPSLKEDLRHSLALIGMFSQDILKANIKDNPILSILKSYLTDSSAVREWILSSNISEEEYKTLKDNFLATIDFLNYPLEVKNSIFDLLSIMVAGSLKDDLELRDATERERLAREDIEPIVERFTRKLPPNNSIGIISKDKEVIEPEDFNLASILFTRFMAFFPTPMSKNSLNKLEELRVAYKGKIPSTELIKIIGSSVKGMTYKGRVFLKALFQYFITLKNVELEENSLSALTTASFDKANRETINSEYYSIANTVISEILDDKNFGYLKTHLANALAKKIKPSEFEKYKGNPKLLFDKMRKSILSTQIIVKLGRAIDENSHLPSLVFTSFDPLLDAIIKNIGTELFTYTFGAISQFSDSPEFFNVDSVKWITSPEIGGSEELLLYSKSYEKKSVDELTKSEQLANNGAPGEEVTEKVMEESQKQLSNFDTEDTTNSIVSMTTKGLTEILKQSVINPQEEVSATTIAKIQSALKEYKDNLIENKYKFEDRLKKDLLSREAKIEEALSNLKNDPDIPSALAISLRDFFKTIGEKIAEHEPDTVETTKKLFEGLGVEYEGTPANRVPIKKEKFKKKTPTISPLTKTGRELGERAELFGIKVPTKTTEEIKNTVEDVFTAYKNKYGQLLKDFKAQKIINPNTKKPLTIDYYPAIFSKINNELSKNYKKNKEKLRDWMKAHTQVANDVGRALWSIYGILYGTPEEFIGEINKVLTELNDKTKPLLEEKDKTSRDKIVKDLLKKLLSLSKDDFTEIAGIIRDKLNLNLESEQTKPIKSNKDVLESFDNFGRNYLKGLLKTKFREQFINNTLADLFPTDGTASKRNSKLGNNEDIMLHLTAICNIYTNKLSKLIDNGELTSLTLVKAIDETMAEIEKNIKDDRTRSIIKNRLEKDTIDTISTAMVDLQGMCERLNIKTTDKLAKEKAEEDKINEEADEAEFKQVTLLDEVAEAFHKGVVGYVREMAAEDYKVEFSPEVIGKALSNILIETENLKKGVKEPAKRAFDKILFILNHPDLAEKGWEIGKERIVADLREGVIKHNLTEKDINRISQETYSIGSIPFSVIEEGAKELLREYKTKRLSERNLTINDLDFSLFNIVKNYSEQITMPGALGTKVENSIRAYMKRAWRMITYNTTPEIRAEKKAEITKFVVDLITCDAGLPLEAITNSAEAFKNSIIEMTGLEFDKIWDEMEKANEIGERLRSSLVAAVEHNLLPSTVKANAVVSSFLFSKFLGEMPEEQAKLLKGDKVRIPTASRQIALLNQMSDENIQKMSDDLRKLALDLQDENLDKKVSQEGKPILDALRINLEAWLNLKSRIDNDWAKIIQPNKNLIKAFLKNVLRIKRGEYVSNEKLETLRDIYLNYRKTLSTELLEKPISALQQTNDILYKSIMSVLTGREDFDFSGYDKLSNAVKEALEEFTEKASVAHLKKILPRRPPQYQPIQFDSKLMKYAKIIRASILSGKELTEEEMQDNFDLVSELWNVPRCTKEKAERLEKLIDKVLEEYSNTRAYLTRDIPDTDDVKPIVNFNSPYYIDLLNEIIDSYPASLSDKILGIYFSQLFSGISTITVNFCNTGLNAFFHNLMYIFVYNIKEGSPTEALKELLQGCGEFIRGGFYDLLKSLGGGTPEGLPIQHGARLPQTSINEAAKTITDPLSSIRSKFLYPLKGILKVMLGLGRYSDFRFGRFAIGASWGIQMSELAKNLGFERGSKEFEAFKTLLQLDYAPNKEEVMELAEELKNPDNWKDPDNLLKIRTWSEKTQRAFTTAVREVLSIKDEKVSDEEIIDLFNKCDKRTKFLIQRMYEQFIFSFLPKETQTNLAKQYSASTYNSQTDPIYAETWLGAMANYLSKKLSSPLAADKLNLNGEHWGVRAGAQVEKLGKTGMKALLFALRILARIIDNSNEWGPWGFVRLSHMKAKQEEYKIEEAALDTVRIKTFIGTGILGMLGIILASEMGGDDDDDPRKKRFWIDVSGPRDEKQRNVWQANGHQRNTIWLYGKRFPLVYLPNSIPLAVLGSLFEYHKYNSDMDEGKLNKLFGSALATIEGATGAMISQSYFNTMGDLLSGLMDSKNKGKAFQSINNLAITAVPYVGANIFRQLIDYMDGVVYDKPYNRAVYDKYVASLLRQMPAPACFKKGYMFPMLNAFGEPIRKPSGVIPFTAVSALASKFSGEYIGPEGRSFGAPLEVDPAWETLARNGLGISAVKNNVQLGGFVMPDDVRFCYTVLRGTIIKKLLNSPQIVQILDNNNVPLPIKQKFLDMCVQQIDADAKTIIQTNPSYHKIISDWNNKLLTDEEFLRQSLKLSGKSVEAAYLDWVSQRNANAVNNQR
jgi:hypothetical protein